MAVLVLINGAPASGKSTLARLWSAERRLSLVLDIDTIRGSLARWEDDPTASGLAARRLAVSMCTAHLSNGLDVVVPQFLQKENFIEELASAASEVQARFVEVCLTNSAEQASLMYSDRATSMDTNHQASRLLQEMSGARPIDQLYNTMLDMVKDRPATMLVESIPGDVEKSLDNLKSAIG